MKTCASIFGGMGAWEYGAMAAGLTPLWTVECDPAIAGVYERNVGRHAVVARAEDVDYSRLERPDWLHMSPVCTNASVAKKDRGETEEDREMARACARAIVALMPDEISLENVWNYRNFDSFRIVTDALTRCGYYYDFWHLNAADYGVPQTRKRLILLASLHGRPHRPTPAHSKRGDLFTARWVGWLEVIEDLLPTLPESKFAPWQLKRLGGAFTETVLVNNHFGDARGDSVNSRPPSCPAHSITALNPVRAFILSNSKTEYGDGVRESGEPMLAVTTQHKGRLRAFIMDGRNSRTTTDEPPTIRTGAEPCFTVPASDGCERHRAFVEGLPQSQPDLIQRGPDWLSQGRVVSMTPRALARFQSIPDSVVLPEHNGLACKVIGNAVPSLLARRMVESRMEAIRRAA